MSVIPCSRHDSASRRSLLSAEGGGRCCPRCSLPSSEPLRRHAWAVGAKTRPRRSKGPTNCSSNKSACRAELYASLELLQHDGAEVGHRERALQERLERAQF